LKLIVLLLLAHRVVPLLRSETSATGGKADSGAASARQIIGSRPRFSILSQFLANIVADYASLFLIRSWLVWGGQRPLTALITAPIIGLLIVVAVYLIRDVGGFSIQTRTFHLSYFLDDFIEWYGFIYNRGLRWSLLFPALLVHLWLPLFALGVLVAKAVNSVRTAGRFSVVFLTRRRTSSAFDRLRCSCRDLRGRSP